MIRLSTISPFLLYQFKSEHDLLEAIAELAKGFTTHRESLSEYLRDERLTSAYTAFYLLTNIPKFSETMKWMNPEWLNEIKKCTFIDLGAGPGTFSLAWREWLGQKTPGIVQIETSEVMQRQAKFLWMGLYPTEELLKSWSKEQEKILFFGHSANEMGAETAIKYIREINPEHLLFIEPGTKEFFKVMLKIREYLLSSGYNVLYPCPTSDQCPMKDMDEWCHQFLRVRQDSEIERISQMARKDRRNLPIIAHAYSRTFKGENPSGRIIRVLPETKFSFEWQVCEENHLENYQVQKRSIEKATLNQFSDVLAGAAVEVEVEKTLPQSKRVKIKKLN